MGFSLQRPKTQGVIGSLPQGFFAVDPTRQPATACPCAPHPPRTLLVLVITNSKSPVSRTLGAQGWSRFLLSPRVPLSVHVLFQTRSPRRHKEHRTLRPPHLQCKYLRFSSWSPITLRKATEIMSRLTMKQASHSFPMAGPHSLRTTPW